MSWLGERLRALFSSSAARDQRLLAEALDASPLIAALPPELRRQLAHAFVPCTARAGETLLTRRQPGNGLYFLVRGRCAVFHTDEEGRQVSYPDLEEGALFGEVSLLRRHLATATVKALTPCTLLRLAPDVFEKSFRHQPELRQALVKLGLERLQRTLELQSKP